MDKKDVTFADVSRSLNRLDGFLDDMLLTIQSYCDGKIDIEKSINSFLSELKWLREGDESINYLGVHDCVDFILNSQSLALAKRAFSIQSRLVEIEQIILSYTYVSIKATSDLLWQTGRILWEIGELHIEPFIISETGDNDFGGDDCLVNDFPEWKDVKDEIKTLFGYPNNYKNFLRGCFLPNRNVRDIKGIVDSYNRNRTQNDKPVEKGVPTLLYAFLCKIGVIIVPKDKPGKKLRAFQRKFQQLNTELSKY